MAPSDAHDSRLAKHNKFMDGFAWGSNVIVSVAIIFMMKGLMSVYHFTFATTLCGLHFLSCAVFLRSAAALGFFEHKPVPLKDLLVFCMIGSVSIASANLSLLMNSVGFYQIAKLMLAPFVCSIESAFFGKRFSIPVLMCILVTIIGVGIVTVSDFDVKFAGTVMAAVFIVSSGFQQILCGHFQAKHKLASWQLLANTSLVQGVMLTVCGPFVDQMLTGKWVLDWDASVPGMNMLLASCFIAVAVNLSQFLCLGRFTATTFQVLGHAKTILVLFGGWALFHDSISPRKLVGIVLAMTGMIAYGHFMQRGDVVASNRLSNSSGGGDDASSAGSSSVRKSPTGIKV